MGKIVKLHHEIISKIAAGEVIERPAYAVKELLENSIDAQATYIRLDIEKSGLQKIVITDNGEGMSREDVEICFQGHATSKVKLLEDLHHITSLGFRGEALSSIASVSNMTIKSRTADTLMGTEIALDGAKIKDVSSAGMAQGTTIVVEELFTHLPVRKKFLRSQLTEFRHIFQIITDTALAYPHIRFFVTHNKRMVLDLPTQQIEDRVQSVLGETIFQNLLQLQFEQSYIKLQGFISRPQLSQHSQQKNFIFINNRLVKNRLISSAVKEAYGTLLPPESFPTFVLKLQIPFEYVDVNVHPRKEEVYFYNPELVIETVKLAVSETLMNNNLTFQDRRWQRSKGHENVYHTSSLVREGKTGSYAADLLKDELHKTQQLTKLPSTADFIQINDTYILTETTTGFLLIDQHAAHERILYEKLFHSFKKERALSQQYMLPKTILIDLSLQDASILEENLQLINDLGFEVEHFSGNTFKVNTVPMLFKDRDITEMLTEIITDLSQNKNPKDIDIRSHRMISYIACRSAIKAGDNLTKKQMKELIEELQRTKNYATCPHGRPTQIEISLKELNKLFHRIS